jgi:hypothetical protein
MTCTRRGRQTADAARIDDRDARARTVNYELRLTRCVRPALCSVRADETRALALA